MAHRNDYEMHVISNTHWDREWRFSFQRTRMQLVNVMDHLLGLLEKHPEYVCYHLDSQTIILEDYLQICPENEQRLKDLIKNERIMVGPWYSAPDMNNVTGESIVRNLLLGHSISKEFGNTMKVGYTPFSWGQVSQMPQIYAGFGIDTIFFYRGVDRRKLDKAEFWWQSPDGTRILTSQMGVWPRYNFYVHVYRPVVDGRKLGEFDMAWENIGLPAHLCNEGDQYEYIYALDHPRQFIEENIEPGMNALLDEDTQRFTTRYLLLMQGCDTTIPNPDEPRLYKEINNRLKEGKLIHSTLPAYAKKLKKAVKNLMTLKGEMRFPLKYSNGAQLIGDVITSRIYLKQANTEALSNIEKWAEPFSTIAWRMGVEYPLSYLERSWKYILANQSHDSLAGCGVDQVHEDMMNRYAQANEITRELTRASLSEIVKHIDTSHIEKTGSVLTVFNALPYERSEVVTAYVDIDINNPEQSFELIDLHNNNIPTQLKFTEEAENIVLLRSDWPQGFKARRTCIHLEAKNIPALGYKTYTISSCNSNMRSHGSLLVSARTMENEFLRVTINNNGSIRVEHKKTGKKYDRLNTFEDSGECGTPWVQQSPEEDKVCLSTSERGSICLTESGPLITTFKIEKRMRVPITSDAKGRSKNTGLLKIVSWVTLKKNSRRVDITTKVFNNIRNHRLRVLFPIGLQASASSALMPFDIVDRPVKREDRSTWAEKTSYSQPQNGLVDLSDGIGGLAILSKGLPDYEVYDDESGTIAVTLIRGFAEIGMGFGFPPFEKEGPQCLGERTYQYAIYPHSGTWDSAEACIESMFHSTSFKIIQSGKRKHKGRLPRKLSFWKISSPNILLSGVKKAENDDTVIVRLYNPTSRQIRTTLSSHFKIKKVWEVSMEEKRIKQIECETEKSVGLTISKKKVLTLEIEEGE